MKRRVLKTISVLLTFLVVFSTFSFTVEKHFCGNTLIGIGVFSSAKKCKTEMHSCGVEGGFHKTNKKDSCCSNKKENIDGQDELKISSFSFNLFHHNLEIPQFFISDHLLHELPLKEIPYRYYKPPLLVSDFWMFYQVFII